MGLLAQNTATVSGTVADEESGQPLEFAAVALLSLSDSSVVQGTVADLDGKFTLKASPGEYLLRVNFLSYITLYKGPIPLSGNTSLGTLALRADAVSLQAVEVVGERSRVEMTLDKRMYNVGEDLANIGGSAADALGNIPSVTVDVDGTVNLRGSSNVRILANGKPSGLTSLSSTEALQQLPANAIERVEVITNPSARYDAEGTAGIINIVLKKNQERGFNGTVNLSGGYPTTVDGSLNLNYRKGIVNVFGLYGLGYDNRPGGGLSSRLDTKTGELLDQYQTFYRSNLTHTMRAGAELFFNEYTTLTGSVVLRSGKGTVDSQIDFLRYNDAGDLISRQDRNSLEQQVEPNVDYNVIFTRTFPQEGREFSAQFQLGNSSEQELTDIIEQDLDPTSEEEIGIPLLQRSSVVEDNENLLLTADYIHPFGGGGQFEAGYRGTMRDISNNYLLEQYNTTGVGWETLNGQADNLSYGENVHAAYAIVGQDFDLISVQGGLRAEYTDIDITSLESGETATKDYLNFFPSAFLTYEPTQANSWQLSYSRRVQRPRFRQLNPFSGFFNSQNIRLGNPDLNPEFTHSIEGTYIRNTEIGTYLTSLYYRYTQGEIEYITTFEDSVTITRPINLGTENSYGLELGTSLDATKWLRIDGDLNFFRAITQGTYLDQDFYADAFSWSGRLNANMKFDPLNAQTIFRYRAPRNTTQGRRLARYSLDVNVSKEILNGNGTVSLRVRDLFNSNIGRSITEGEGFYQTSEFQWRRRQFTGTFIYRINQKNREERGERNRNRGNSGDFGDDEM